MNRPLVATDKASPPAVAPGNAQASNVLPGIVWSAPWRISVDFICQPTPLLLGKTDIMLGLDAPILLTFDRGTLTVPAGNVRIQVNDGATNDYTDNYPITAGVTNNLTVTFDGTNITATLNTVDAIGGPQPFAPPATTPNAEILFSSANANPTTIIDQVEVDYG